MPEPARRFLAPNGRTTTQPLRRVPEDPDTHREIVDKVRDHASLLDEPECLSPSIVEPMTDLARHYDQLRYAAELEQAQGERRVQSPEQRLVNLADRARRQRVDLTSQLHVITKVLLRTRKGNGKLDRVTRLIEQAEARLDRRPDLED